MSTADNNKKLVQQIFSDSARRSGSTLVDHFAEDVRWVITGQWSWSRTFEGRDAVVNGMMKKVASLLAERMSTQASNFIAD